MTGRAETDEKLVALTFDDGPNEPYTSRLLDLLDREKVTVTFFTVGKSVRAHPAVVKRAAAAGHTIGNHSLSHRFSKYLTSPGFKTEITETQTIITETIGQTPHLFRPPWLFRQPLMLATVKKLGLVPISGTFIHPFEVFQPSAEAMAKSAVRRTRPGSILIFHDGYNGKTSKRDQTIEAVELIIKRLKRDGYRFLTVDELLGIKPYTS